MGGSRLLLMRECSADEIEWETPRAHLVSIYAGGVICSLRLAVNPFGMLRLAAGHTTKRRVESIECDRSEIKGDFAVLYLEC